MVLPARSVLRVYLLVLLSFGIGIRNLGRLWRPVLLLATTYILITLSSRVFVPGALNRKSLHWLYAAEYVPFALSSLIAIPLRLAASVRRRLQLVLPRPDPPRQTVSITERKFRRFAACDRAGVVHSSSGAFGLCVLGRATC